jgi:hypothetical protein
VRLVPTFTGHTLRKFGQFCLAPLHALINVFCTKNQKFWSMVVGMVFFLHVCASWRWCAICTLAVSSICLQCLTIFIGRIRQSLNITLRFKKLNFNMVVVWDTTFSSYLKDEEVQLLGQWESYFDANNSRPSNAQFFVWRSFAPRSLRSLPLQGAWHRQCVL